MLVCEMNAKHFRWLFLTALLALLAFLSYLQDPVTIGLSVEMSQDKYHIAGGTAPWALAFAALFIGLYFLLMFATSAKHGQPFCGWWRRMSAFWLDFILAMTAVGAVLGILPMFAEWRRTGVFAWNFERTTSAPGDGLLFVCLFVLAVPALALYYAWPLVRRRPSPGACIMGYQIVADEGVTLTWEAALKRTLLGWSTFLGDRKRAKLRVDGTYNTHAVKLK
jgi:hypothetical protein